MGFTWKSLLYLSLYFKQHRQVYYDLLDRVRTDGDWEAWIDFFLEGVEQTANSAVQTARWSICSSRTLNEGGEAL